MSRPDEGLIHQWLDGECTPEESARIERLVATDAEWAAAVAEARGLIAASSRIIGALDAVPRAMPAGSVAAPQTSPAGRTPRQTLKLPAWIGLAAGVVLVAGTAYVMREQAGAPFAVAPPPQGSPAAFDTAAGVQVVRDPSALVPPQTVPTMEPTLPAAATAPAVGLAAPSAPPPAPVADAAIAEQRKEAEDLFAGRAAALSTERDRVLATERQRALRAAEAPRGAITRAAEPAAAVAGTSAALPRLDGCWRVSAPPEAVGLLEAPPIRRSVGDTLVLVTVRGDVTVLRVGDTLRGGLQATLEPCRSPE